jgi:uncharacterized protein (DUF1697 family)
MTRYVAFLRAVNVGGTGKLPMADLRKMFAELGFGDVKTYIASGNVAFNSDKSEEAIKSVLEERLAAYAGKPVAVFVRTAAEMRRILDDSPFAGKAPNFTFVVFLERKAPPDAVDNAVRLVEEEVRIGKREIYVHYPNGVSQSKLRIPAAEHGTARNINTVKKMVDMTSGQ